MRDSILVNMPNFFLLNFVKSQVHKNSNAAKSINFMFFTIDKKPDDNRFTLVNMRNMIEETPKLHAID